ncbi:MAG: hypothetical protein RR321_04475 [Acidaminococcaceae bacterium]
MYPNLEAEIARNKLTNAECARVCGISEKSFSNKRTGKTEFVLSEMKSIKDSFFGDCSLEYLFATKN